MSRLTSKTLKSVLSKIFLIHVVDTSDTSDNAAGSSFKATLASVMDLFEITKNSYAKNITAFATGTQLGATQLTKRRNRVDICATNNDSVKFLQGYAGLEQEVYNNTANDLAVFPFVGDNFLGLATDIPIILVADQSLKFFCYEVNVLTIQ